MKQEYDFSGAERGKFGHAGASLKLPAGRSEAAWAGPDGALGRFVAAETKKTLDAYRAQPNHVTEHANQEHDTAHGGYAHRQLYELVQNGADALSQAGTGQSILIRLTEQFLYCADDGKPIDEAGVTGLMFSHMSSKRGTAEIGRFGMGFKSVLGVTDRPEFFSRSGSIRFDGNQAAERIGRVVPGADRYPALRLPESIDPNHEAAEDDDLREFMSWATNIVRLPLKYNAFRDLAKQIGEFPPEFLLFVPHVRYLTLECSNGESREFTLRRESEELELDTGESSSRWRCWETTHTLSDAARQDSRALDDAGDVRIAWAAPLEALSGSGHFWAFFPTQTACLLAGILNAPWKTNEDRQNLLAGPYNDELIGAAARLVAGKLPSLTAPDDPARHLDALPRREEAGDGAHSRRLRESLLTAFERQAIVPDQEGRLRAINEVSYAPEELTSPRVVQAPLDYWQSHEHRPKDWAHHAVLTRNTSFRLAKLNELFGDTGTPRASLADWLLALKDGWSVEDSVEASKAAIQIAALIPLEARRDSRFLGDIVLSQSGDWRTPDPDTLSLPVIPSMPFSAPDEHLVHVDLATDERAANDLRQLGLREVSDESAFKLVVAELRPKDGGLTLIPQLRLDDSWWRQFWAKSRAVDVNRVLSMLSGVEHELCMHTVSGDWKPMDSVLLPGDIVPADGSRDAKVAVDPGFHADDVDLLRRIGVVERPNERDVSTESWFYDFLCRCRQSYKSSNLPQNPQDHYLNFESTRSVGPLEVLRLLSDEGAALYVNALLGVESSYSPWQMGHKTRSDVYPKIGYKNPALITIASHGRIRCAGGFADFDDAIGQTPKSPKARQALLSHPMADRIRTVFALTEPQFDAIGEEDPVPFADVWPGALAVWSGAPTAWPRYNLVRCQHLVGDDGSESACVRKDSDVYLVSTGDDASDLRLVAHEVGAELDDNELDAILRFVAHNERRAGVREQSTDAAKLLCAVGEEALRRHLPRSLISALEATGDTLADIDVAKAAIATFHTGALVECRLELDDLAPPSRWAGSPRAVEFVQSLGFAPEWAGERQARRAPFIEVEGPFSLPELHRYQHHIVGNVVDALGRGRTGGSARRGMISLPTGAGKTRVTVQAIVQAIRDGIYTGGVLWVADRDELCEQAVEAWRQVWSSKGTAAMPLRISRMWGQQPPPMATSESHVVVATIQTLHARLSKGHPAYRFISDFGLVVFDEAHRSVAPSYTSVMEEIGFTRWRRHGEPILLGLTATPYCGHDERETGRLVGRYGRNRLDNGAFSSEDPISVVGELQEMGVLAQADHETISGGSFSLTKNEAAEIEAMQRPAWLPRSIEQRIASDTNRTLGIVDAYESYIAKTNRDWPTLIFATSVEHAQTVAALLNTKGVTARAVSGTTDRAVRRRIVDDFRAGKINVLVNYGVFREGFDAPKTRAILVARPVYSPNLYFQMIGRGLRGPKNGGSERCLVINVQDNIDNFDRQLAFADLDWLWA